MNVTPNSNYLLVAKCFNADVREDKGLLILPDVATRRAPKPDDWDDSKEWIENPVDFLVREKTNVCRVLAVGPKCELFHEGDVLDHTFVRSKHNYGNDIFRSPYGKDEWLIRETVLDPPAKFREGALQDSGWESMVTSGADLNEEDALEI